MPKNFPGSGGGGEVVAPTFLPKKKRRRRKKVVEDSSSQKKHPKPKVEQCGTMGIVAGKGGFDMEKLEEVDGGHGDGSL